MSQASAARRWGGVVVAVTLTIGVFGWASTRRPLHFDGAMNLQVARMLVDEGEYARQYDYAREPELDTSPPWTRAHPYEVQTNGPFVFAAAVGVALFDDDPLGYQFASLAFVVLFTAVVWGLLRRRWPVVSAVAPAVLLLVLPDPFGNVIGGLGEIPGLALVLAGVFLTVEAVHAEDRNRAVLALTAGSAMVGLAVVTKTYLLGAAAAMAVGWLIVWHLRRLSKRSIVLQPVALAAPLVAFEVYKAANLGGLSAYRSWWSEQAGGIAAQSGVQEETGSAPSRVADQLHRLADLTGIPAELLVLLTGAATVAAGLMAWQLWRSDHQRSLELELSLAQVMTAVVGLTYLVWWLGFMPERWAIARRTYPIVLPLALSLVLLVAVLGLHFTRTKWLAPASTVAVLILAVLAGSFSTVTDEATSDQYFLPANRAMADRLRSAPADQQLYGIGFWSAPILSLMADRPLRNLEEADPCDLPGDAVLVLDRSGWAALGVDPPTLDGAYRYEPLVTEPAARLYRIEATRVGCARTPDERPES